MTTMFNIALRCFIIKALIYNIVYSQTAPTPLQVNETTIEFSFDDLQGGNPGTEYPFVNAQTIEGWWSNKDSYIASNGVTNEGGLYSFGSVGSSARAIGTVCSNNAKTIIFGLSMTSNYTINAVNITIYYQSYRYGGNFPSSLLELSYLVSSLPAYPGAWGVNGNPDGWTVVDELSYQCPINSTSGIPVGPLINVTQVLSTSIALPVPQQFVLQLRFAARSSRDGLGVNSVQITLVPAPPTSNPSPNPNSGPSSSSTSSSSSGLSSTSSTSSTGSGPIKLSEFNWKLVALVLLGALPPSIIAVMALSFLLHKERKRRREESIPLMHAPLPQIDNSTANIPYTQMVDRLSSGDWSVQPIFLQGPPTFIPSQPSPSIPSMFHSIPPSLFPTINSHEHMNFPSTTSNNRTPTTPNHDTSSHAHHTHNCETCGQPQ